jgi:hypothetical protein
MDRARSSLPVIVYPAPDAVPNARDLAAVLPPPARALCLAALQTPCEAASAVRAVAALTPPPVAEPPIDLAAMIEAGESANLEVHDAFFNIARGGHDHPAQALIAVLQSRSALWADLAETPSALSDEDLALLDGGLAATLAALLGVAAPEAAAPPRTAAPLRHGDYIARRWLRGHQIFTALTQGLILAVNAIQTAANDSVSRNAAVDLMALVLDASGRALEFTGDFRVDVYDEIIRVNMSPPYQPEGFSGLLSADHRELVLRMKGARAAFDRLRAEDPFRHAKMVDALAGVYDRHKAVCSKFVGTQRASLLLMTEDGRRSGVEQLQRFKVNRLRQLGPKAVALGA